MYSRRARRASRGRSPSHGPVRRWWLVVGGTSIPVLVVAYAFVTPHGEQAVDNTAMGNENPGALTMVSASDVTEATPSALTGGNAFTITWDRDQTAHQAGITVITAG